MSAFFERLKAAGFQAIDELFANAQEETLHLEFKELSKTSGEFTKQDRTFVAKALCGLANAEGGVLLLGIKTRKDNGLDVAVDAVPISNLDGFRNVLTSALPQMINPEHSGIEVLPLLMENGSAGVVAIHVPRSEIRPHMSMKDHLFYRRGSDRTSMMEHREIRDMMLAPQQGHLELVPTYVEAGGQPHHFDIQINLTLRNVGRVPVTAPYVKAWGSTVALANSPATERRHSDGSKGYYCDPATILFPEDEISLAATISGLELLIEEFRGERVDAARPIAFSGDIDRFRIRRWTGKDNPPVGDIRGFQIAYGAQNAPRQTSVFAPGKWEIFYGVFPSLMPKGE